MGKQLAKYGFTLIGIYLGVAYASGAGQLISSGSQGIATVTRSLQGR